GGAIKDLIMRTGSGIPIYACFRPSAPCNRQRTQKLWQRWLVFRLEATAGLWQDARACANSRKVKEDEIERPRQVNDCIIRTRDTRAVPLVELRSRQDRSAGEDRLLQTHHGWRRHEVSAGNRTSGMACGRKRHLSGEGIGWSYSSRLRTDVHQRVAFPGNHQFGGSGGSCAGQQSHG